MQAVSGLCVSKKWGPGLESPKYSSYSSLACVATPAQVAPEKKERAAALWTLLCTLCHVEDTEMGR